MHLAPSYIIPTTAWEDVPRADALRRGKKSMRLGDTGAEINQRGRVADGIAERPSSSARMEDVFHIQYCGRKLFHYICDLHFKTFGAEFKQCFMQSYIYTPILSRDNIIMLSLCCC